MENLKVYITNDDIKKYLLIHKEDENIKYKEVLFLKYLNDTDYRTLEKFDMYLRHVKDRKSFYEKYNILDLFTFDKYVSIISQYHNIELEDIMLMLIPILELNDLFISDINKDNSYINNYSYLLNPVIKIEDFINELIFNLKGLSKEYKNSAGKNIVDLNIKRIAVFNDILDDYINLHEAGIINSNDNFSLIGKERCEQEIASYSEIYGNRPIEIIESYVKEIKVRQK